MRRFVPWFVAIVAAAAGGCVGIQSLQFDEGVVYHLPRSLLTITVAQYTAEGRTWYQIGKPEKPKAGDADTAGDIYDNLGQIDSVSIPDPSHRYVAKYRPSPLSDDRLCVSRSPNGLLQDLNFAADDRTPQVVFNIARFIAGSMGGPRKTGITHGAEGKGAPVVRAYTGRIDPLSRGDRDMFNRAMYDTFGEVVELDFTRMEVMFKNHTAPLPNGCRFGEDCGPEAWTDRCTADQICYRTQLDVPIDLKRNGKRVDVNYAKVINPHDIGAISVTRAFLVHKISNFRFDNGVLIGAVIRKPSEIEELSLLPLQVVYAALVTPSQAFATAFNGTDQGKEDILAQIKENTVAIEDNNAKIKALYEGMAPSPSFTDTYSLQCEAPTRDGSFSSIVTGGS